MSLQEAHKRLSEKITLPSLPEAVTRITAMVNDSNVRIGDIGAVVAQDPAICATVLRIANSAYYGLAKPAATPVTQTFFRHSCWSGLRVWSGLNVIGLLLPMTITQTRCHALHP